MPPPPAPRPPAPAAGANRPAPTRPQGTAAGGRPVTTNWSFNPAEHTSINEGAFRNLPIGANVFLIKKVTFEPRRNANPPENQVIVILDLNGEGDEYPVYLAVCSSDTARVEMANKQLKGFADAAGVTAILNPRNLNLLQDKWVAVTTVAKPDKQNPQVTRVNIQRIDAPEYEEDEDQIPGLENQAQQTPPQEQELPPNPDQPEPEPEPEPEVPQPPAPAAPAAGKTQPWRKPRPPANPDSAP